MIADAEVEAIANRIVQKLPDVWLARSPICSAEEAMKYLQLKSPRSFRRHCATHKIERMPGGGFSRRAIERSAERAAASFL